MLYVGIDGGGTSTKLEIRSNENLTIARHVYDAFNISSIGETAFRALMRQIAQAEDVSHWQAVCVGGAGASYSGLEAMIREEWAAYGFAGQLQLVSDSVIALHGALSGPGCVLIAGTGSIGYGEREGVSARVGGWGHLLDDPGSGYAIGRDGLAAALRHADGRQQADLLYHEMLRAINGHDIQDILNYVYYSGRGKADIAALAPCVLRGAEQGDPACLRILRDNARELGQIAQTLANRLELKKPRVALLGGLMAGGTLYRSLVEEEVNKTAEVVPAEHDALWGAAQMAWELRRDTATK